MSYSCHLQLIGTLHNFVTVEDNPLQRVVLSGEGNGVECSHAVDYQLARLAVFHDTLTAAALVGSVRWLVLAGTLQALVSLLVDALQLALVDFAELSILYYGCQPAGANRHQP